MTEEVMSEKECRDDIEHLRNSAAFLQGVVVPAMKKDLKWRFILFWFFLWVFILLDKGIAVSFGLGASALLVLHVIYHLYDCKCAISKAYEAIAYIEDYIKKHHQPSHEEKDS